MTAATAMSDTGRPPGHELPQRRLTWQARRTRSGWTLIFRLRAFRLLEMTFLVNIPNRQLIDGQTGTAIVRFFIDRSQEDKPGAPIESANDD